MNFLKGKIGMSVDITIFLFHAGENYMLLQSALQLVQALEGMKSTIHSFVVPRNSMKSEAFRKRKLLSKKRESQLVKIDHVLKKRFYHSLAVYGRALLFLFFSDLLFLFC